VGLEALEIAFDSLPGHIDGFFDGIAVRDATGQGFRLILSGFDRGILAAYFFPGHRDETITRLVQLSPTSRIIITRKPMRKPVMACPS
jgi:hypothetical protein